MVQKVLLNIWEQKIWGSTLDWEYSVFFPQAACVTDWKIIFRTDLNAVLIFTAVYESMKLETSTNHNVFYEEKKVCNKGRAGYLLDVASSKNFSVTEDFAAAVCNLTEHFDKNVYRNFIDKWGTVS